MLKVEENYVAGIPQTAVLNFAPRGLVWHWTAGATGRAGAQGTINHFVNTRNTINASYHILLFREGQTTVAHWIVPVGRASHSLNPSNAFLPKTGSTREQARFTEVHRILARDNDPNADCISVSFCGMPADLAAAMQDPEFRADVKKLEQQLIAHSTIIDQPNFGHGWIQPRTRYETDATPEGTDLLIAQLSLISMEEQNMADIDTFLLETVRVDGGAAIRAAPVDDAALIYMTGDPSGATTVGTKNGYHALWLKAKNRWGYTSTLHNILSREPYRVVVEKIVEKIVEVPSGITQEQVNAAADVAREAEQERIALAEAERIRNT